MADEQTAETTAEPTAQPPAAEPPKEPTAEPAAPKPEGKPAAEPKPEPGPWYGEVDDDLKKVGDRFASPVEALRSLADFRKRESQVRVPGKDATDEDRAKYLKAIGVPDKPEAYEFPALTEEELTDQVKESRAAWAQTFHKLGVSKDQAKALIEAYAAEHAAEMQAAVEADKRFAKESEAALKKEWGADYDKNLILANRAVATAANRAGVNMEELRKIEMKSGQFLLDHPAIIRLNAIWGREMQEGTLGGAVSEDERDGIEEQIQAVKKQQTEARGRGDTRALERLYQRELELFGKLAGNQPIVGSRGRAA